MIRKGAKRDIIQDSKYPVLHFIFPTLEYINVTSVLTNFSLRDAGFQQAAAVIIVVSKIPGRYTDSICMCRIVNTVCWYSG